MLAFQTSPNINIIDTGKTCPCCKDDLNESAIDYIKISCGHEYHYDCILDAFEFNKKRGTNVLECPYCRLAVKPIPIKDNYDYCNTIHGGLTYIPGISDKWNIKHKGPSCCQYKNKNNLYCNSAVSLSSFNKIYCWSHSNVEHIGHHFCAFKKNENYCNKYSGSELYCYKHKTYENAKKCIYTFASGYNKGNKCDKWCWLTEANPVSLCLSHLKHKDKFIENSNHVVNNNGLVCNYIYQRGTKKGQTCGIINCKNSTHKSNTKKLENSGEQVNTNKIVSIVNVAEPPIIVHVEKSEEKIDSKNTAIGMNKMDSIFRMELKELLIDIIPNVSVQTQLDIEHFLNKYHLD